jgi:large subunit ribosomal protein L10
MKKEEKDLAIDELITELANSTVVYITDTSTLTVEATNRLRRSCFDSNVKLRVVKNTFLKKAMERVEGKNFTELMGLLHGPTAIMISEHGNTPAKVIKEFRKKSDRPVLKGAYVDEACFVGDDMIEALVNLKGKNELIGDVLMLLQSPAKNVVSALQSGKNTLGGLMKTLEERANN